MFTYMSIEIGIRSNKPWSNDAVLTKLFHLLQDFRLPVLKLLPLYKLLYDFLAFLRLVYYFSSNCALFGLYHLFNHLGHETIIFGRFFLRQVRRHENTFIFLILFLI